MLTNTQGIHANKQKQIVYIFQLLVQIALVC